MPIPNQGLWAAYSFETLVGGMLADDSGQGRAASTPGGATLVSGRHGQALEFASGAWVELPTAGVGLPFAASLWAYRATKSSGEEMLYCLGANETGKALLIEFDGDFVLFGAYGGGEHTDRIVFDYANRWTHLVHQSDGARRQAFIDGVMILDKLSSTQLPVNHHRLGMIPSHNLFYSGRLDSVRLYNRMLSPGEIQALFLESGPGTGRGRRGALAGMGGGSGLGANYGLFGLNRAVEFGLGAGIGGAGLVASGLGIGAGGLGGLRSPQGDAAVRLDRSFLGVETRGAVKSSAGGGGGRVEPMRGADAVRQSLFWGLDAAAIGRTGLTATLSGEPVRSAAGLSWSVRDGDPTRLGTRSALADPRLIVAPPLPRIDLDGVDLSPWTLGASIESRLDQPFVSLRLELSPHWDGRAVQARLRDRDRIRLRVVCDGMERCFLLEEHEAANGRTVLLGRSEQVRFEAPKARTLALAGPGSAAELLLTVFREIEPEFAGLDWRAQSPMLRPDVLLSGTPGALLARLAQAGGAVVLPDAGGGFRVVAHGALRRIDPVGRLTDDETSRVSTRTEFAQGNAVEVEYGTAGGIRARFVPAPDGPGRRVRVYFERGIPSSPVFEAQGGTVRPLGRFLERRVETVVFDQGTGLLEFPLSRLLGAVDGNGQSRAVAGAAGSRRVAIEGFFGRARVEYEAAFHMVEVAGPDGAVVLRASDVAGSGVVRAILGDGPATDPGPLFREALLSDAGAALALADALLETQRRDRLLVELVAARSDLAAGDSVGLDVACAGAPGPALIVRSRLEIRSGTVENHLTLEQTL